MTWLARPLLASLPIYAIGFLVVLTVAMLLCAGK